MYTAPNSINSRKYRSVTSAISPCNASESFVPLLFESDPLRSQCSTRAGRFSIGIVVVVVPVLLLFFKGTDDDDDDIGDDESTEKVLRLFCALFVMSKARERFEGDPAARRQNMFR